VKPSYCTMTAWARLPLGTHYECLGANNVTVIFCLCDFVPLQICIFILFQTQIGKFPNVEFEGGCYTTRNMTFE
jgi:hypothetical protein